MMFRDTVNLNIKHSPCIQQYHSSPICLRTVTLCSVFRAATLTSAFKAGGIAHPAVTPTPYSADKNVNIVEKQR